jgi:putative transcriptional regulator
MKTKEISFDAEALVASVEAMADHVRGERKLTLRRRTLLPSPVKPLAAQDVLEIRQRLNFSQAVFASLLNVSRVTAISWEKGRRRPSGAALRLLELARRRPEVFQEVGSSLTPTHPGRVFLPCGKSGFASKGSIRGGREASSRVQSGGWALWELGWKKSVETRGIGAQRIEARVMDSEPLDPPVALHSPGRPSPKTARPPFVSSSMKFAVVMDPGVREGISIEASKFGNRSLTPFPRFRK